MDSLYTQERLRYQNCADWELLRVKRALQMLGLLNSERENARLQAVGDILNERKYITGRVVA